MADIVRARVTQGGQISLPAEIRRRWGVDEVQIIDDGAEIVVRPLPADPISALRGVCAGPYPTTADWRAEERAAEADHDERRWRER